MIPILYDGWPLSYSPNSPGALHLLTLLEVRSGEFEPVVALPTAGPSWIPKDIPTRVVGVENTPTGRLLWEQSKLPALARELDAQLVHITTYSPALFAPIKSVISPAGFISPPFGGPAGSAGSNRDIWEAGQREGLAERLRRSLSQGTYERVLALFWPGDLPYYGTKAEPAHIKRLPPVVHPAFLGGQDQASDDLSETYILYQGPYNRDSVQNLLQAWSWAAGPLGDNCSLVLAGVREDLLSPLGNLITVSGLSDSIQVLPVLSPSELAGLYQGCKGLFHPGELSIWDGPLRHAMSCGRPIIAANSLLAEALLGPAAYLVPEKDFRGMGAALITIVVEEEVEERLSRAARERSAHWDLGLFREALARTYQNLVRAG